ncbi:MAG: Phosphatidate cytidylyltransferase [Burkholderiaceae bacterium]|jgi:phosphatidate cytidylyltransferase|nr:MAG: Phosphatidate cytidylyltransferase [Burkholderiaceae bacterium]
MLKQRIITAAILLAVLLPALFYPEPQPFNAVALILIAAAGWEWARLNGCGGAVAWAAGAVCVLLCLAGWAAGLPTRATPWLWRGVGAVWVVVGILLLRYGVAGWPRIARPLRIVVGLAALCAAWLALAQARAIGINFLLSILLLVWVADVFAYAAGRTLGLRFTRRRLAPGISPGKSWEGVWGALVGVVLMAVAWVWADTRWQAQVPSLYSRLAAHGWWLLPAVLFLVAMSVVGDLVESLVKRSAGVKDSSGLLPGHGGVLDRVDALLPTLPLAMMLATW